MKCSPIYRSIIRRKTSNEGADHCYGCGADLSCFMDRFSQHLWEVSRSDDRTQRFFITNHMAPQSWSVVANHQNAFFCRISFYRSCDFKEHLRDFILIYFGSEPDTAEKVANDMYRVFEYVGVPKYLRDEIRQEMSSKFPFLFAQHQNTSKPAYRHVVTVLLTAYEKKGEITTQSGVTNTLTEFLIKSN